jgi:hypothetical protein
VAAVFQDEIRWNLMRSEIYDRIYTRRAGRYRKEIRPAGVSARRLQAGDGFATGLLMIRKLTSLKLYIY